MNQLTRFKRAYERRCHTQFRRALDRRFGGESWARKMQEYRNYPARFAREVLGTTWWAAQERVARSLVQYRRVAVKSGNGVGKTFLAADLALWFLYCHRPAVVITTAPTWRQVRHLLWQEIRKRVRSAQVRLPGKLLTTRLEPGEGWFALGLSADKDVRFQGFHAENLLVIFDEASGIPDDIWDAAEAVAVGFNNRILAIGNPLIAEGRFYRAFQRPGWLQITINAMHHPNITGKGQEIPGCVTREYLEERIADWCEPTESYSSSSSASAVDVRGSPSDQSDESDPSDPSYSSLPTDARSRSPDGDATTQRPNDPTTQQTTPDAVIWKNKSYVPNNLFRARVLGAFPDANDESLIPLRWVEQAVDRWAITPDEGHVRAAIDVARFGNDLTVIGLRQGHKVVDIQAKEGTDLMQVVGLIQQVIRDRRPESVLVDSIGIGAGVVDRLIELGLSGINGVNVSHAAWNPERYANKRAELFWGLRERFRVGDVAIPRNTQLIEQLTSIRYKITSMGKIQIESKDEMKRRKQKSPDHADMLAMLFDSSWDWVGNWNPSDRPLSPAAKLRLEMQGW